MDDGGDRLSIKKTVHSFRASLVCSDLVPPLISPPGISPRRHLPRTVYCFLPPTCSAHAVSKTLRYPGQLPGEPKAKWLQPTGSRLPLVAVLGYCGRQVQAEADPKGGTLWVSHLPGSTAPHKPSDTCKILNGGKILTKFTHLSVNSLLLGPSAPCWGGPLALRPIYGTPASGLRVNAYW